MRDTAASQLPRGGARGAENAVTFLVTLGEKSTAPERWDGSAEISGGTLLHTEGWHFSAGDSVAAAGSWQCSNRKDEIAPFADVHYTEMRPGSRPPVLFQPVGVFLTVQPEGEARVAVRTSQGNFDFPLAAIGFERNEFLSGRATVIRVPGAEKLSDSGFEDDEPAIATLPDGGTAAAWVAYRGEADRLMLRTAHNGTWSASEQVSPKPADIFRCSLATDDQGNLWAFWSEREGEQWQIRARRKSGGSWQPPERLSTSGTNSFNRAASAGGRMFVVWQSFRGGQSDIYMRSFSRGAWTEEMRISESPANDWEPAVGAAPDGAAYIAWDSYDKGDYDVWFRSWRDGHLSPARAVTSSPRFQAHAAIAVDAQNRPWVAWDESGVNWGKDQGFLIPTPLAVPLHQQRSIRLAVWDGKSWLEPKSGPAAAFPPEMRQNAEHPQIVFDGKGSLTMVFRHWTRRNSRTIGSPIDWENYVTRFDGAKWSAPAPFPYSAGPVEKNSALARDPDGEIRAAWMTDGRPFRTQVPVEGDIYCGRLGAPRSASLPASAFQPFTEAFVEAIPVHNTESADVRAIRAYTIASGGKQYKIYRGDMHRHTDVSQDFKYDGSLLEVYRYGLDVAGFDYIAPTDHQAGYDQEFTWWQNQKLVDLFLVPGAFTPLYAYERSLNYPNGHRNIIFDHRGVRTLPIPPDEASGKTGAAKLYEYLRKNHGISMPHSSATSQGTDWRDNDPDLEPLIEIYQGYRNSYEYEGAPRAATALNPQAQKSGWEPAGFWWNALVKGYRLGVQSSSDHWSTHISYACIVADRFTREGLVDAMRKRHAYAATDNIILDFRARAGGNSYIMGDVIPSAAPVEFSIRSTGTGAIKQVDLIRNRAFVYTSRPGTKQTSFEFSDKTPVPGESWYYVRILQEDGQMAWSSPIWVRR